MVVSLPQGKMRVLGDPHLGKKFYHSVPVSRLGQRETMVFQDFQSKFEDLEDIRFHVCLGDLFDSQEISWDLLMRVVNVYSEASINYPNTKFFVLRGNHDVSKREETSVFDVFFKLMENYNNVKVIKDLYYDSKLKGLFIPWTYSKYTKDDIRKYIGKNFKNLELVFMHDDPENLFLDFWSEFPVKELYNGHIHYPSCFSNRGYNVYFVGSMQPYAHSEDNTGSLYMTITEEELRKDPTRYKEKILRVIKTSDEPLPEVDVLGLNVVYHETSFNTNTGELELKDTDEVETKKFDDDTTDYLNNVDVLNINQILERLMEKYNVPEHLKDWIRQGCSTD